MMMQRHRQQLHSLRTTLHMITPEARGLVGSTNIITRDSDIFNDRRFDGHLCDTSLVDTLLVVNPSLRHVTHRHVIRHQPIVRNATTASTLRYGLSNHRQCQVDRSSNDWYRSVSHAVARTTTITGSTTDKPYPPSHSSNKTSPSSQTPGFAPPAHG